VSQENVELARAYFEGWTSSAPDFSVFHPDLVYHPRSDEPDPSAHIGLEAYERLVRGFVDAFSEVTVEVLDLIDAGDRVIASTVIHGLIGGGGEVTDNYVFVYRLHDGLVVEGWEYRTTEEALEAVDSSE
jgi:ketosteroid isomerase-like protein